MNRRRNTWIVVVVVCLLLCCCATAVVGGVGAILGLIPWRWAGNLNIDNIRVGGIGVEATTTVDRQEFAVERDAALEVSCPVCDVQISAVEGSVIAVEGSLHAWGSDRQAAELALEDIEVSLSQEGGRVVAAVLMPNQNWGVNWRGQRGSRVDLEITVPRRTDLEMDVDVGTVEVEGIEGLIDVRADVGDLMLRDVVARDKFTVRTDVARVRFEGSLSEGVRYDIRSGVGEINVTLPADSSFELDAESNVGDVRSGFAVSGTEERKALVGGRISGTVGNAPTAELVLRSDIGAIWVNRD
jgi:hypothetical protein